MIIWGQIMSYPDGNITSFTKEKDTNFLYSIITAFLKYLINSKMWLFFAENVKK